MNNGYSIILFSFAVTSFIFALFIFKDLYKKKEISYYLLFFLLILPPTFSIFRPGLYESGDFNIHIYRAIEFYNSLSEGILMPSWAPNLNSTYGYPLFIFNYPLPYYFTSFFHFLGFSFEMSMKLLLSLSYLVSGVFIYKSAKIFFKNEKAAFISAIFYQFSPYYLVDLHFRTAIGEILTFSFMPIFFYFLQRLWINKSLINYLFPALAGSLLIMSHPLISFIFLVLISAYSLHQTVFSRIKTLASTVTVIFLSLISTLYVWIGPIFLSKYTITSKMIFDGNIATAQISDLLFSPWRYGFLFQGPIGQLNPPIGYPHLLIVIVLILVLIKKNIKKSQSKDLVFFLGSFWVLVFLMSEYSSAIWSIVKIALVVTAPQRIFVPVVFVAALLAGFISHSLIKKKFAFWVLILFTVLSTILNWGHRRVISTMNDTNLYENLPNSTREAEGHWYANSKWRNVNDFWFESVPSNKIEILSGNGSIVSLERKSNTHKYLVEADSEMLVKENTLYFQGWEGYINNKRIALIPDREGIINFRIPKGLHFIEIKYKDVEIYTTLKLISFLSLFVLVILIIFLYLRSTVFKVKF